jgi:hypothetical protein
MRASAKFALIGCLLLGSSIASAGMMTIDFEGLGDGTVLGSQYPGVEFTNASVWTAGLTLNELEFPPHSGTNVAADVAGPVTILFDTPVLNVSAFFTYSNMVTLDAFDSLNQSVGTSTSAFSSNVVSSGNAPNEMLQLSFAGGISKVTLTGTANGFVFDDLAITTATTTNTPEPSFGLAVALGLLLIGSMNTRSIASRSKGGPPAPRRTPAPGCAMHQSSVAACRS